MPRTRKGLRLHIGLFGRRNTGKSSLLNALLRQKAAIVSPTAGTTTDPVEKPMELQPLGPVLFIDTAGVDDEGALGEQRIAATRRVLDRTDLGLIVCDAARWGAFEEGLRAELAARGVPVIAVFSKADLVAEDEAERCRLQGLGLATVRVAAGAPQLETDALGRAPGMAELREALLERAPEDWIANPPLLADLIRPGEPVVLVVPIDKEAPTGRLILPQQQAIREALDADAWCLVVKERELRGALEALGRPPALVVTDSQAFLKVAADTPPGIPMTSFSILFARRQGDLAELARGAAAIDGLRPGDRVLMAEACGHHPSGEDIGRVKIPRWLRQAVGGALEFDHVQGHDFPEDLSRWKLVVHCGACMWNRREVLSRMLHCRRAGVPMTNYGITIAASLGILERALAPFPAALEAWRSELAAAKEAGR
jgi:[FeFe] hydrogenase H-cluster maturation GTPase HydF